MMSDQSIESNDELQLQIHINDLTEDCFLAVFSLLTNIREKLRLRRVCKRWHAIIEKSIIYHHTRLTNVNDIYYENEISNLQHSIDNHNRNGFDPNRYRISLAKIFTSYLNLKVFHLIKNPYFVNALFDWNLNDNSLTNLSLLEIKIVNDDQMNDELLSSLICKCPKLVRLELINCFNVNGDFLFSILSKLKNLRLEQCQIVSK